MRSPFFRRLLENQLQLHARSRGPRRERPGATCFEASAPDLRYWLLSEAVALPADLREVRTLPGVSLAAELGGLGFSRDGALRYFWMDVPDQASPRPPGITLERLDGSWPPQQLERFLRTFSAVQAEGYAAPGATPDVEGTLARNLRGAGEPDEASHLASLEGVPAAAAHTFFADGLLGIYGVATSPAHRNRGLATALLHACFAEARAREAQAVTLQTWADSAPERLYRRHGFIPAFDVGLFVRGKPTRASRR